MQLEVEWTKLKDFLDDRSINCQFAEFDNVYIIAGIDGPFSFSCNIEKESPASADQTDFETNYKAAGNTILVPLTDVRGIPKVSINKSEGSSSTLVSYDWTDSSTWYQKSTRATAETLTLDTGKIYDFANDKVIDLTHGRLYAEDTFLAGHELNVYDNAVLKTEDTDYTMDYTLGKVTFDAGYTVTGPITADYSYAADSTYTIAPAAGKVLHIEHAELQFSKNVQMSPVSFEIWVYNPADLPNKIKYQEIIYKNIKDIINAANLGQGFIPAVDGLTQDIMVFPFNYATVKSLKDSDGAELRIRIMDDIPYIGEFATTTLYILSEGL